MDRQLAMNRMESGPSPVGTLRRWLMFNAVGGMGVGVQLLSLGVLADMLGLDYRLATALAVQAAVLHNFVWHEHWTWSDRCADRRGRWARFGSFTLVNGTLSIAGNVLFTSLYVTTFDLHHVPANLLAIATCSIANFFASHHVVFRTAAKPALLATILATGNVAGLGAAELKDKTVAAWERYIEATERRIAEELAGGERFLAQDFDADAARARRAVLAGDVLVDSVETRAADGRKIDVPSGAIHHWRGSILIPGVTLDDFLHGLMYEVAPEELKDDVLESRLLASDGNRREVFLKVRRRSVVTVHYNTEHRVEYRRHGPGRASSRSVATRIAELEDVGSAAEREKPIGRDRGFLWRLNAYWRYQEGHAEPRDPRGRPLDGPADHQPDGPLRAVRDAGVDGAGAAGARGVRAHGRARRGQAWRAGGHSGGNAARVVAGSMTPALNAAEMAAATNRAAHSPLPAALPAAVASSNRTNPPSDTRRHSVERRSKAAS